ncbi:c-type cytochrome [Nitrosococcus watsonii]|uniref:Cytochrome c class I n=1 Tax=Nitrosococcus watsoni (strain C-113) TaxID=105559 RepID=D8K5U2_NITWC|nr:c-type cytochrome [Nitrosococcus watsonii]ADJ28269.1 cytochrome c class I [Nitrosococcus watsonii C-113]
MAWPRTLIARLKSLNWRQQWPAVAVFVGALALGGVLVAVAGIIPIKASSGHWAITDFLLHFAMERSVATHSLSIQAPELAKASLVLRGAGHYETDCRFCHGSPRLRYPPIAQQMTPPPPYLPETVSSWEDRELFYIIKHGVKFTGMPAWPALQRDDEVWAMVAFLRVLPEMDGGEYEQLVWGEIPVSLEAEEAPPAVTKSCGRCHGVDGLGRGVGAFPRLAGQNRDYLYASLEAYGQGKRPSGMMEPIAAELNSEEIKALARYYSGLPPYQPPLPPLREAAAIERGEAIAKQGNQRIASCADCHGPSSIPRNPDYPLLAGQYAEYIILQLELLAQEKRGGTPYVHLMDPIAHRLSPQQREDVARYYTSLTPSGSVDPAKGAP